MSTQPPPDLFAELPPSLSKELITALGQIENNFRERRWEPSELNGGKLCEIAYTILRGYVDGSYPSKATKPSNMLAACRDLEKAEKALPRSARIQIPRMLIALYEIRNNRGVGHVGGDVNPNEMDATCVVHMSKWVVAELVRIFHKTTTEQATEIVSALSNRELALIWDAGGTKRVLDHTMSGVKQTLLLLYAEPGGLTEKELVASIEPSNTANFRRDVLRPSHKKRLLEYNQSAGTAIISPKGIELVEEQILR